MLAQEAAPAGSSLASWTPLVVMLAIYALIVVALTIFGKPRRSATGLLDTWAASGGLERVTRLPGWAAASMGTAMYGLLIAGEGFYSDVAWHIALGRDKDLFTAPHTSIVIGLAMILSSAVVGVLLATFGHERVGTRVGALVVPWSMIPLGVLGVSALMGFPLDELWHRQYGIDVTMWSPTHMLMILGASFAGLAIWLVLAEARVSPRDSRWARGAHVIAAFFTLQGLASAQGEFAFGVPQFQQIFHPILVCLAAAFALVASRIVHGRGWTVLVTCLSLLSLGGDNSTPVVSREGGFYVGSALVIEAVALLLGTERRLRFAVASGIGVGTVGLATEWIYNQGAYQPWNANLLPDALVLGVVVAIGSAVLGIAFARTIVREPLTMRVPRWAVAAAGIAVLVTLAIPMRRDVGDVQADVRLETVGDSEVLVRAQLTPADAADDARWFQTIAWQGGSLVVAEMDEVGDGEYVSDRPLLITGKGKVIIRLHRGDELMAFPVRLPADAEIGEPEVPAVDRAGPFTSETDFLLRETKPGDTWFSYLIYALLTGVAVLWAATFRLIAGRVGQPPVVDSRPLVDA